MSRDQRIVIDIWSDYVCPFCYLEMPVIEKLKRDFGDRVVVSWRAFELRPEPAPTLPPQGKYLQDTWERLVYPMAKDRGMTLRLPPVQPRSRMAFEAAWHARDVNAFDAMHAGLFRAFFEHGQDIGEMGTLLAIAATLEIDAGPLQDALESARHAQQIAEDRALAEQLGMQGVPFLIVRLDGQPFEDGMALRGAVPYDRLHAAVSSQSVALH
jgi:predicted DsbA family dithiol-disulfide isomerase